MDGIKTIQFEDLQSGHMNKTINKVKKNVYAYMFDKITSYYTTMVAQDDMKDLEKITKRIANAIARDITDGNSSVSQKMFAVTKNMKVYMDIMATEDERDKAKGKIDKMLDNINLTLTDRMMSFLENIQNYINHQKFDFKFITDVKGIAWTTASSLYLIIKDNSSADIPYVKAYLQYEIFEEEATNRQKLWLTHNEITKQLKSVINDGLDTFDVHEVKSIMDNVIHAVLNDENVVSKIRMSALGVDEPAYASAIYYKQFYQLFNALDERIKKSTPLVSDDYVQQGKLDDIIQEVEEELGFAFTLEQRQAIYASCQNSVFLLTGLAGTGKSTSVKAIIRIYEKLGYTPSSILGTSFTGQATYNLRESVGLLATQCATAHRWLACNNFLPKDVDINLPRYEEVGLIVIDEFSMVSLDLMNQILHGLENNKDAKILFVGDIGQIPSIDIGFAYDFLMSEIGQQIELSEVVRQKEDSIIPEIANDIREGKVHDVLTDEYYRGKNFRFISKVGIDNMVNQATKAFLSYEKKYPETINDMQILTNTVRISNFINKSIQHERSKTGHIDNKAYYYDPLLDNYYHVNDRVVIRRNMNIVDGDDESKIVFNGAKGYIKDIQFDVDPFMSDTLTMKDTYQEHALHELGNVTQITIQFDNEDLGLIEFNETSGVTRDMSLAYATTIHKSQGSTHEHTILVVGRANMLNASQLIYTGITRTSKTLTLISSPNIIKDAVSVDIYRNARTLYQDIIKALNQNDILN